MGNIFWNYCFISIALGKLICYYYSRLDIILGWGGTIIGVVFIIDYFIRTNKQSMMVHTKITFFKVNQ